MRFYVKDCVRLCGFGVHQARWLSANVGIPQYTITLGEPIEKEVQKSSKGNAGYLFIHYKNHR
jgi:hypothetical protein